MKLFVGISVKLQQWKSQSRCLSVMRGEGRHSHGVGHGHSPHFQEDLPELRSHLHQRVQVAAVGGHAQSLKVVRLELLLFPAATEMSTWLVAKEESLPQRLQLLSSAL